MTDSFDDVDPDLAALMAEVADDFRARLSLGEKPNSSEYAAKYPQAAEEIRGVLGLLQQTDRTAPVRPFAPHSHTIGTLGDFRVGREVGRGGMAIVYEATQISLGRRVALKILPFASLIDPKMLQRFQNEARAAAALDHPHIVKVHAVGQERGVHYIAMQFIDGQPLSELVDSIHGQSAPDPKSRTENLNPNLGPLAATAPGIVSTHPDVQSPRFFQWAAELGAQAADALEHAHSLGVVHRDVKPANLLIDAHGSLWVSDFGLAKVASTDAGVTMTGDVFGTLRFMSPEQALAKHDLVDHRTDVYALGATLYELLSGRPVVAGNDKAAILRQITEAEPVPLRRLNRAVPVNLETVVLKCLRKDPAARYASAKDLADDLRRFAGGKPVRARPVPVWERAGRWARHHPVAVLTILAAVVLSGIGLWLNEKESRRRGDELRLRQQGYSAHIRWAQSAYDNHLAAQLIEILDTQRPKPGQPDVRGFEWYFLRAECDHNPGALRDGEPWAVLDHPSTVGWSQFGPDGQSVFSYSMNERSYIQIWDLRTGTRREMHIHERPMHGARVSPDGKTLAVALTYWAELFEVASGKRKHLTVGPGASFASEHVQHPAFSPDGRKVAIIVRKAGQSLICDGDTTKTLVELQDVPELYTGRFGPDGRTLYTTSWANGDVIAWDVESGTQRWKIENERDRSTWPSFRADGKVMAVAAERGHVYLRKSETGELIEKIPSPVGALSAALSPDGTRLAIGGWDNSVQFWGANGVGWRNRLELPDKPGEVEITADGRLLQVSSGKKVYIWALRQMHEGEAWAVAYSPDGRTLASAGDDLLVRLWDAATGKQIAQFAGHTSLVSCVAYSPDGTLIASGGYDKTVRIWDSTTGVQVGLLEGHTDHLRCVAFSPDGKLLATGSKEHVVRLWDVASRQLLHTLEGHTDGMYTVAFSPDGRRLASASRDGTVRLWNPTTGREMKILIDANNMWALAFSRDGKAIATGNDEGIVKIWNAASGEEQMLLAGHRGEVRSVAFSPDGLRIASAGYDRTIRIWDLATGTELLVLKGHAGPVNGIAFAPDGSSLASAGHDGVVKFWRAPRE